MIKKASDYRYFLSDYNAFLAKAIEG